MMTMNTSSTHVQEIGDPLLDEMSMSIFDSVSAPLPDGMGAIAQRDGFGASTCDSNGGHRRKPVVSSSKVRMELLLLHLILPLLVIPISCESRRLTTFLFRLYLHTV
mmetsp:Transcript_2202/g.3613  ORF Transcript_2202/g.3613 Transcript_2202/m.3613 type:complete len:107 (-) Transcript_2202:511-831(-)